MSDLKKNSRVALDEMYKDYFLHYASYVILERAIPSIHDGLKPVQRRLMHSLRKMHDGRYHKVANIIGHTMQYHPHGDAAIGAALVHLGQKDLLIDTQGNWGDIHTGDSAAAPRYIEARLTPFALDVLFNPQTTEWQLSYDGRNQEPIALPAKFPILLAMGVDGIAVGLSTKILPHNFIELCQASIALLKNPNKNINLYPDFQTGGMVDIGEYQDGERGGKIKVRAKIEVYDKKHLTITELPYGVTTSQLIDSILKANEKGKIKIKSITDNTAKDVHILIELVPGMSPELCIDALYAFTQCEESISPNACVIVDNKPQFLTIREILAFSTEQTKNLLLQELEIKKAELDDKWHFASLEKIFIQERIYRDIEQCESWEEVVSVVMNGLHEYVKTPANKRPSKKRIELHRNITEDDITRLADIKIKRISKYNVFKAEEALQQLVDELEQVAYDMAHLTEFTIAFYEDILSKYGKGRERKTQITAFYEIEAKQVVINNTSLYVNRTDGFIGWGLKKDEFVTECSDLDDIIAITKSGDMMVTRIGEKTFVGKDIIHVDVWKKGDERTTYNLIYREGKRGTSFAKRFHVSSITRDKIYSLTNGTEGSLIHYLTINPQGEAEIVEARLTANCKARNKEIEFDFSQLPIRGRGAKGITVTKYPIRSVKILESGESTLDALRYYLDQRTGQIKTEVSDLFIGEFNADELCIAFYSDGRYHTFVPIEHKKLDADKLIHIAKLFEDTIVSAVHFEGKKKWTMIKRFEIETSSDDQYYSIISESPDSELLYATTQSGVTLKYSIGRGKGKQTTEVDLDDFIDVKGWKAMGNKLESQKIHVEGVEESEEWSVGDSIEFDLTSGKQGTLF